MKPLVIENGRSRLLFTPETGGFQLDLDGSGLIQLLTPEQCHELATYVILSVRMRRR